MIVVCLFFLLLFRAFIAWFELAGWSTVALDLVAFTSLLFSVDIVQVQRTVREWNFLKFRDHQKVKRKFLLDFTSTSIKIVSIFFLTLWFTRWIYGAAEVLTHPPYSQDLTYIDVFIFCQVLAFFLDWGPFRRLLVNSQITTARQILIQYGAVVFIATPLLLLPISLRVGQDLSLIDSLFVVVSALSVTGLSPVEVSDVFSLPGQFIILILIQLGGLGVILLIAGFSVAAFNRLSVNHMLVGQEIYGSNIGDIPSFLIRVASFTFVTEFIGAVLFYICLPDNTPHRFFSSIFHSVSAFCNAGFSNFRGGLESGMVSPLATSVLCILVLLGGMGFPVIFDIIKLLQEKKFAFRNLSAYTRLTLIVMMFMLIIGTGVFFALETGRPDVKFEITDRIGYSIFYSIISRTAGFSVTPVSGFHLSTLFWLILLMAVGANPISTGSGIKTTTVGILFLAVYRSLQGYNRVVFQGRTIPPRIVMRAFTVMSLFFITAGMALTLLAMTESAPIVDLGFEVISALATVGASTGVTPQLTVFGKIVIIFLMFFGRIGIIGVVLASMGQAKKTKIKYPEDDFFVG